MSNARPMETSTRIMNYVKQNKGRLKLTPRQLRRLEHKANRLIKEQ